MPLGIASLMLASLLAPVTPLHAKVPEVSKPLLRATQNQVDPALDEIVEMSDPGYATRRMMYIIHRTRLDPPKYSPQKFGDSDPQPFEFDWVINGYAQKSAEDTAKKLTFRVFSQDRKEEGDVAPMVCRMLLRLWDLDYRKLKFDHRELYRNMVDVYLCWGGTPGGMQKMDVDYDGTPPQHVQVRVDTIYIFDLGSFNSPMEMAREVAHEYGHAVLTPVGGFVTPEDWGNGQLGEKLFLRWCRDELAAGRLEPKDVMGVTKEVLDVWLKKNVDPLVLANAESGPAFALLEGTGQASMDAFTGLVSYADAILPEDVVGDSLRLMTDSSAKSYPPALLQACELKQRVVVGIPPLLQGKDLWVPLGNGKVTGATVIKRQGDWAQIRPGLTAITLRYPG